MIFATVITDASHCGETNAAGWAAYIRIDGQKAPVKMYAPFKKPLTTSMEAELLAAINGMCLAKFHGAEQILLQTDCLAVVSLINGQTRKRRLRNKFFAACDLAKLDPTEVRARHVKGHTRVQDARSYVNRWCDKNARAAMRQYRKQLVSLEGVIDT